MKKLICIIFATLSFSALAEMTTHTYWVNGKPTTCTTNCFGNSCTTNCF